MYYLAISIIIFIILLIIIFLQIDSIQKKIIDLKTSKIGSNDDHSTLLNKSSVSLYSLILDTKTTLRCNDVSRPLYQQLIQLNKNNQFVLPNLCKNNITNVSTPVNKVGILVVRKNASSISLEEDLLNGRIQYIVVNNQLMLITYNNEIQQAVEDANIAETSVAVFVVYGIPNTNVDNKCSINIMSFMGKSVLNDSSSVSNMDMRLILNIGSEFELPVQIVGYKL